MDTARLDYFSYNDKSKTPNINHFIKDTGAIAFENAITPAPWTIPSHVSLFTGKYPSEHGSIDYGFKIDKKKPFLPNLFSQSGYFTVGITSNSLLTSSSDFDYGFDKYICTWNLFQDIKEHYRSMKTIKNKGLKGLFEVSGSIIKNKPVRNLANIIYRKWYSVQKNSTKSSIRTKDIAIDQIVKSNKNGENLFLFLNFMQPHMNYNPPAFAKEKFVSKDYNQPYQSPIEFYSGLYEDEKIKYFRELYQSEIFTLDQILGEIIDKISELNLMDDSAIILVSDHGEHIGDHSHISHYFSVYNELINVPLIVKFPNEFQKKISLNSSKDIVPTHSLFNTLLEFIEQKKYKTDVGSLFDNSKNFAISELFMPSEYSYFIEECKRLSSGEFIVEDFILNGFQNQQAIISNNLKYIVKEKGNNELYDFYADPNETNNLISSNRPDYNSFVDGVFPHVSIYDNAIKRGQMSEKLMRRMRSLGYY